MRKLQKHLFYLLILPMLFLAPLLSSAQSVVVNNPSQCRIGLNLTDGGCDPATVIPDPDQIVINVNNAPGTALGQDVYLREVRLIIRHTWDNDLDIWLRSPAGIVVPLSLDNGDQDDNYGDPNAPNCTGYMRFTMESCVSITEGQAPFTDQPYRPQGSLFDFNDGVTDPNHPWTLIICDDAFDDVGRLDYVHLVFAPISCLPVEKIQIVQVDTTSVTLNWTPANSCGTSVIEYGPVGFQPGSGPAAGAGQVMAVNGCPPFTLTGLQGETEYEVYVRKNCNGNYSANSCPALFTTGCQPPAASLRTHFDNQASCGSLCSTVCDFAGEVWYNSQSDGFDWLVDGGGTFTFGTGPSDDVSGGGKYIYLEASGDICQPNKTAYLMSDCIQLDKMGTDTCHLSFFYHMYGDGIGRLQFQVSDNGGQSWATLWEKAGNQGDAWHKAYIGLGDYADGSILQFRFAGKEGSNSRGDIALDEIVIHGSTSLGPPAYEYFADADNDGYGNPAITLRSCSAAPPAGYTAVGGDCNDGNPAIHPDADEIPCNDIDENCNGLDDDPILPPPAVTFDTICSGETAVLTATIAYDRFIFWYGSPDGDDVIGFGETFIPDPPLENNGPVPVTYSFYAEETDFICGSGSRAEAIVAVNPLPDVSTTSQPSICKGDTFDLASITIQDLNFTGGSATFHSGLPATDANKLGNTLVSPAQTTTYYFKVTSPDGCSDAGSVTVQVKNGPALAFNPGNAFSLCRENSTPLSVQASGGGAPYSYFWSTGATTSSITVHSNFVAGATDKYYVTVTNNQGCSSYDSVSVTTTVTIDSLRRFVTDVSTCDGDDGSILLVPLDGEGPFTYAWQGSGGISGDTSGVTDTLLIANLPQGAYRVTVTDSSPEGCSIFLRSVIINGPGAVVQGINIQPVSCTGAANGQICLNIFGGSPQLQWSNSGSTPCISGLAGGSYSVTLTDQCETIIPDIIVPEPEALGLAANLVPPTCSNTSNGRIELSVFGGAPPYSYHWSNNGAVKNAVNLAGGTYSVTITDANSCTYTQSFNLPAPSAVSISLLAQSDVSCFGLHDGALQVEGQGGTAPYQYTWNTGSIAPLVVNLGQGTYHVTVTDFNGCPQQGTYSIGTPTPLELTLGDVYEPECVGDKNGQIEVLASGGTPPYQFSWNYPGTDSILSNLPVGTYVAYLTDANNCPPDSLVTVLSAISVLELAVNVNAPQCVGLENGSITLVPGAGAQPPFSYEWNTGHTTPMLPNIGVGEYSVRIIDGQDCQFDTTIQVVAPQVFTVNLNVVNPSCHNGADGLIVPTIVQSGVPPISFDWCNGSTLPSLIGISDGLYCVAISDNVGCSLAIDSIRIESPPALELGIESIGAILCHGDSTGFIEVDLRGGIPPYGFEWVGMDLFTEDIYNIPAGSYRLLAQDANSCPIDTTFVLAQPPMLSVDVGIEAEDICEGGTVEQLFGEVAGGTPPYSLLWSSGDTFSTISNPVPGDYVLTVTDDNRCTEVSNSVKVPEFASAFQLDTFFVSNISCYGAANGCATVMVSGGTHRYTYHFSDGYILSNVSADSITRCGMGPGNYKVTILDLNTGCSIVSPFHLITQPQQLLFKRDSIESADCYNGADGAIYTTASGGTPPYYFTWFNSQSELVGSTADLIGVTGGFYTGYATDSHGCTATVTGTVPSSSTQIRDTLVQVHAVRCKGGSSGAVNLSILGGTPAYTYAWSNGAVSPNLSGVPAGAYELTVTDNYGCTVAFGPFVVPEPATTIELVAALDTVSCFGQADGAITVEVSGGNAPYRYEWAYQGQIIPIPDTNHLDGLAAGLYTLSLRDSNNCLKIYNFEIPQPSPILIDISLTPPSPPGPGLATASVSGGIPGYTLLWNTGDTTATIVVEEGSAYFLTATDASGCQATAEIYVTSTFETALVQSARLYPNPASHRLWLELQLSEPLDIELSVASLLGQPLIRQQYTRLQSERLEIDIETLPAGVYWLLLHSEGRMVYATRFVKGG
ncbi:MAG: T9SS type A sorting domain-containing protein [Phaeodactylibacter sp.]|nr:T9SS type A sorting domain-containing protein [Phaeodactylibacter sp.]